MGVRGRGEGEGEEGEKGRKGRERDKGGEGEVPRLGSRERAEFGNEKSRKE